MERGGPVVVPAVRSEGEAVSGERWVAGFRAAMLSRHEVTILKPSRSFADQTLHQIVHTDGGGRRIRIRLSNLYGKEPLRVARTRVAPLPAAGPRAVAEPRAGHKLDDGGQVTFGGAAAVTIAAGAEAVSDPVDLAVPAGADLVISNYLPVETGPATFAHSGWQPGYLVDGDTVGEVELAGPAEFTARYYLSGVDVLAPDDRRVVVAFGDSLLEGAITTVGANRRFTDLLNERLRGVSGGVSGGDSRGDWGESRGGSGGPRTWAVNAGLGGNRLLNDEIGERGLTRFDRDVLAVPGVRHVILHFGVNDLGLPGVFGFATVTAEELIAGLTALAARGRAAGLTVLAATIAPFGGSPAMDSPAGHRARLAVNEWIRTGAEFDSVVDLAAALGDPAEPTRLRPEFDSGDRVHPNDLGARAMADAVDLAALG
jgi:lysophospholipase L1-like esterase